MSATGLGLSIFLLLHVLGNLIILISPAKFNVYAHTMSTNPLLVPAELGLLAVLVIHVAIAIKLTRQNSQARPVSYYKMENTGRSRRWWGSSHMGITGTLILVFLIYHLIQFKYGSSIPTTQDGIAMRDLAATVKHEFSEWEEVVLYVIAMIVIFMHLLHGFRSAFETLGMATSRWERAFFWGTRFFVYAVMGGFILIPLWIFFRSGGS
jgi:succinate dehydrogenase / fumarate reductase cytochrome b subunit